MTKADKDFYHYCLRTFDNKEWDFSLMIFKLYKQGCILVKITKSIISGYFRLHFEYGNIKYLEFVVKTKQIGYNEFSNFVKVHVERLV